MKKNTDPKADAAGSGAPQVTAPHSTDDKPSAETPAKGRGRKRIMLALIALIALGAGGYQGWHWWTTGRFQVSTDDAYLHSDMTLLAAKVSGYVTEVAVRDNQPVRAGQVIARIDDGDYRLAVQAANDRILIQQAAVERITSRISASDADIASAEADIARAQAEADRAEREYQRQSKLAKGEFASRQTLDRATADRRKAAADLKAAEASLAAVKANITVLQAERHEAGENLRSLRTALAQAIRDQSFTTIRAPVAGIVGNRAVEVGQYVQPGTRLAAIVPLDDVYIDANFKETQLAELRAGQEVSVHVDAFPDRSFTGHVDSISPASGALFSLLPPENATGNFTKVVQRMPVRIRLDGENDAETGLLRPGMSVIVTIDVRTGPDDAARTAATGPAAGPAAN